MGRKVEGRPPEEVFEFVPESYKNREDPNPIKIFIKEPTERMRRKFMAKIGSSHDKQGKFLMELYHEAQETAVAMCVDRVENYEVRGVLITDGPTLAEHGESPIISEAADEIIKRNVLMEEEKKRLSESSTSTRSRTAQRPGSTTRKRRKAKNAAAVSAG